MEVKLRTKYASIGVVAGFLIGGSAVAQYATPPEPNFGPAPGSMTFKDTDPGETIGGVLTMGRAIDGEGNPVDEGVEGIAAYITHWGLEVGEPGVDDDGGNGDLGGDCKGFRDTNHITIVPVANLGTPDDNQLEMDIPQGTKVPSDAVYFVGHTVYAQGNIHNLNKCIQIPVENWVE
jgi:hypothetical protein